MKKLFKKPIAVILVLAMVLGSVSAFATTFNDGNKRTVCYMVKYFIDADGDGTPDTETTKPEEGELFWARLYIKTDYVVAAHEFSLLYNKNFATAMTYDEDTGAIVACQNNVANDISIAKASYSNSSRSGSFYVFTNATAGRYKVLVNDGVLDSDTPDTYGLIELFGTKGVTGEFSYDTYTYQFMFKVNSGSDRTDDSFRLFIPSGVIRDYDNWDSTDYSTYFTRVDEADEEGVSYGKAGSSSDPSDWEEYYPSVELELDSNTEALAKAEGDNDTIVSTLENTTFMSEDYTNSYASLGTELTYNIYDTDGTTVLKTATTRYAVGATVDATALIENTIPNGTAYGYDDYNDFYKDLGYAEPTDADYTDLYEIDATKTDAAITTVAGTAATYNMYIKAATFTLTYDLDGGAWVDTSKTNTVDLAYGAAIPAVAAADVTKDGYVFDSITYTTADGKEYTGTTMPAQNVTAKITWAAEPHTITFDSQGGSAVAAITLPAGDKVTKPTDPTYEGYDFGGWYTDTTWATAYTFGKMPAEDITVYAKWNKHPYAIAYDVNGGSWKDDATADDKTVEVDYTDSLPAAPSDKVSNTGSTLTGWKYYTDEAHTTEYTGTTMPAYKLYAVAQWETNKYTLTFDYNDEGETEDLVIKDVPYGADLSAYKPADPTREGYDFQAWVPELTAGDTMPDSDLTFTADWGDPHKNNITYYVFFCDDETDIGLKKEYEPATELEYGSILSDNTPEDPDETGYTLENSDNPWTYYTDEECTVAYTGTEMPDCALYAKARLIAIKYNLTFTITNPDGTTQYTNTEEFNYKDDLSSVALPAAEAKTGYTFAWSASAYIAGADATTLTGNMPAADVTITGSYTKIPYIINYVGETEDGKSVTVKTVTGATINDPLTDPSETEAATVEKAGYSLTWGGYTTLNETLINTAKDGVITINAVYTAGEVKYKVYTYIMDVDGKYPETVEPTYESATAGKSVTYTPAEMTGFTVDPASVLTIASVAGDGTSSVTVKYARNQHTLTYDLVDAKAAYTNDKVKESATLYYGETVPTTSATLTGYTFVGWDVDGDKDVDADDVIPTTMPDKDITATAIWTIKTPTITFDTGADASTVASITADYDTPITAPDDPTKTGYKFAGWDTDGDGVADSLPTTMPENDVKATALWTIQQYTITFAETGDTTIAPITQDYGTAVTKPADPVKKGYEFAGWDKAVPATMPAENMTITAKWTIKTPTITFDTGADASTVNSITADYDTPITAPENPTKTGYTFVGWDTDGDGAADSLPAKMPEDSFTATAIWKINQYTITFADTGDTTIDPITLDYGTAVTKPADPKKNGYTFEGWDVEIPATMPAENMTITAKWEVLKPGVTYDANGGAWADGDTSKNDATVAFGDAIKAYTTNPEKTGYEFLGWSIAKDATVADADLGTMGTDPVKLYAVYGPAKDTKYTVNTYEMDVDGNYSATPTKTETKTGTTEATVTETSAPATGFKLDEDKSTKDLTTVIAADGTAEINIYYAREEYTLEVDTDGDGKTDTPIAPVYYGKNIEDVISENKIDVPEKENYISDGWTDEDGNPITDTSTITKDTKVYPAYKISDVYKVATGFDKTTKKFTYETAYTFDAKYTYDATAGEYVAETTTYDVPDTAIEDGTLMDEYFKFLGWSRTECNIGCTSAAEIADPNADLKAITTGTVDGTTYYAHYQLKTKTVTYNPDNGEEATSYTATVLGAIPVPETDPEKEGFLFGGWKDQDGNLYTSFEEMPAKDLEFTAVWNPDSVDVTVSYVVPDFWGREHTYTYPAVSGDPMPEYDTPYVLGKKFAGWSPELPSTVPETDVTYTAQYEIDPAFVAVVVGGTVIAGGTVAAVCATNAALITGAAVVGGVALVTGAVVLAEHTYKVTYMVDGDVYKTYYVVEGTKVLTPADPTADGKEFAGWSPEIPDKMPGNDLTFEATWAGENNDAAPIDNEIPDTGSAAASFAALAVISSAAAAAYVLSVRKKKEDK